jgi:PBP4 family serine-type D-alanyl-D-alanine carboxypeptidase
VKNPPLHAASVLRAKLREHGISVSKPAVKGISHGEIDTLCASRVRLRDLIKLINKHSDNFLAECLFKTIGAYYSGEQGNSFYSTQAVIKFIKDNGIFSKGTSVVDGSGISRFDQVTVGAVAGLLEKMYFDLKHFQDFYNSLSIAGVDGTLRHRMRGTDAENNFHGKTGTLHGVSSLSGYLKTKDGNELVVSMMFEFTAGGTNLHRGIEDKIVEILADL